MFGFSVTYLLGRSVAADFLSGSEKNKAEWPPHPSRLFSALVNSWADLGKPVDAEEALRWLESLPPPLIATTKNPESREVTTSFVPANDDERLTQSRVRNRRRFPALILDDPIAYVWWPDANPDELVLKSLVRLAEATSYLGHSSSVVTVECCQNMPEPTLVPHEGGEIQIRVPYEGRFNHLRGLFSSGRRPDAGKWQAYTFPGKKVIPIAEGVHSESIIFRLRGPVLLPLVSTLKITTALRKAILKYSPQPVPEVISGHAPNGIGDKPGPLQKPHLAFVALPDVGHRYAGGHLVGLSLVLPRNISAEERKACLQAVGNFKKESSRLILGKLGVWHLESISAEDETKALDTRTWTRSAYSWASVTPFVFGRYPNDPFGNEAQRFIAESFGLAGLPAPSSIDIGRESWILGSPVANDFPAAPSRIGKPQRYHVHIRVRFDQIVRGPVLVGVGKNYGYGLLRPIVEV